MTKATTSKTVEKPFSEVISSCNLIVVAQCYRDLALDSDANNKLYQGATVKIVSSYDSSYVAYGIISKINNTSIDNIHKPSALGLSPKELEELHPQVFELLKREVEAHLFAYPTHQKSFMIHDFVYFPSKEEIITFTENLTNLFNIVKRNGINVEILFDLLYQAFKFRNYNYDYLLRVSKELMLTFSDEVHLIMPVLRKLKV